MRMQIGSFLKRRSYWSTSASAPSPAYNLFTSCIKTKQQ